MAESSDPERVTFKGVTWLASRPQVLRYLQRAKSCFWGQLFEFRGTESDLVEAGLLADRSMFASLDKTGQQRTEGDGFGNRYTVVRRGRGIYELTLRIDAHDRSGAPSDEFPVPCAWWKKHGGEAQATTAAILSCFRKR